MKGLYRIGALALGLLTFVSCAPGASLGSLPPISQSPGAESPGNESPPAATAAPKEPYVFQEGYRALSNQNATEETKLLYNYLCSVYGKHILTGQQESTWMSSPEYEMQIVHDASGKLPAIRGLDYINNDFEGVNRRAVNWWEQGGIVSICWHWGTPPDGVGYESSKETIDLTEALTEGTELYEGMLRQMDEAAIALLALQEAGVPVLWRPFHEFDGAWFWWGKGGAEDFIRLWDLMYDRFTNHHGLNNLIWVLGYSGNCKTGWYPGDETVDIGGADSYNTGTLASMYRRVQSFVPDDMPVCLHECGYVPDPEALQNEGAGWLWFLVWHTTHIKNDNTAEGIAAMYQSEYGITLDELPSFASGR